ncbi:hypothetical protein [Oceanidesulfovibrio marinus]|uniref:Uncharacterized protein n=1 Tax=Oceanidesulfovibrio marinus TaxID=370038 RepID=A0A6P1ZLU8_9BACT|nr:hypothetical protein [Oceanidesulfovibrio marinus]TVM36480.1 hypothetical protein DQK91_00710 [Oceanidesulfovibrio marinus]
MSTREKLLELEDHDLQREYHIESICDLKSNPWLRPSNVIAALALVTTILFGIMSFNLSARNEKLTQDNVQLAQNATSLSTNNTKLVGVAELAKAKMINNVLAIGSANATAEDPDDIDIPRDQTAATVAEINRALPTDKLSSGWIYLGHLQDDNQTWSEGSPETITPIPYAELKKGVAIVVKQDVYLREDTNKAWKSREKIIDVAGVGQRYKVNDIHQTSARNGGYYIWAKVSPL